MSSIPRIDHVPPKKTLYSVNVGLNMPYFSVIRPDVPDLHSKSITRDSAPVILEQSKMTYGGVI